MRTNPRGIGVDGTALFTHYQAQEVRLPTKRKTASELSSLIGIKKLLTASHFSVKAYQPPVPESSLGLPGRWRFFMVSKKHGTPKSSKKGRVPSIEVATRSSIGESSNERLANPKLAPTYAVIGRWECPASLAGNLPDMGMIRQTRELLGYRTNYTLLEWWALFPARRWWSYAIKATRYLSRKPNYKFFLRCLMTAARGGAKFEMYRKVLFKITGKVEGEQLQHEKPLAPVCPTISGVQCPGCERCFPLRTQYAKEYAAWVQRGLEVPGRGVLAPS
jgi:hypothetical protein